MATPLKQYLQGLVSIFYPHVCAACGSVLYFNEKVLCLKCFTELPRTGFHAHVDNEVARLFWGRIPVRNATSFILFNKESRYRKILHELKYKGQEFVGTEMGRLFGLELRGTSFGTADIIHPVPLHPYKLRKRGYNQSELIAGGMAEILQIPLVKDLIIRVEDTRSQTRKSRYERWENVRNTFRIPFPEALHNQHVLLVDDVITTGATIEACAEALLSVPGITVSIASLAYTRLQ
ncbi:MAG: ComF family protein [Bacteroidales bacterium]|nr:ComF family protein [Bacteroidales bacterium]